MIYFLKKRFLLVLFFTFQTVILAQVSLYSFEEIVLNSSGDAFPNGFIRFNNEVYFTAQDDLSVAQLWKTDGTSSGTIKLTNFPDGYQMNLYYTQIYNNKLYFVGNSNGFTPGSMPQLWVTEGTVATTSLFHELPSTELNSFYIFKDFVYYDFNHYLGYYDIANENFQYFQSLSSPQFYEYMNTLYIAVGNNSPGRYLYSLSNTLADTIKLNNSLNLKYGPKAFNNELYLAKEQGGVIWLNKYNPSTQNFTQIMEVPTSSGFQIFNNELYFLGKTATHGNELWKTDGTTHTMVKDIEPGAGNSTFSGIGESILPIEVNGEMYFSSKTSSYGNEVWKTDGTSAGTVLVTETIVGAEPNSDFTFPNSNATDGILFNNLLFFIAYEGSDNFQIFALDPENSELMRFTPDSLAVNQTIHEHYSSGQMMKLDTTLLIGGKFSSNGYQLWKVTPSNYVSINEFDNQNVKIFTDVNDKLIHILKDTDSKLDYFIFDMNGRAVTKGDFENQSYQIDLSNVPKGVYSLRLQDSEKNSKSIKFILQ